ncbi:hypothetical protein PHYSODRAFT_434012, partial [Phytophthora sojae]
LQVTERNPDTKSVVSVVCRFYVKFGREAKPNAKRKRTTQVQYLKLPFRADHIKHHLESVHPRHWKVYAAATDEAKRVY